MELELKNKQNEDDLVAGKEERMALMQQIEDLNRNYAKSTGALRYLEIEKGMLLRYKDEYELITQ